MKVVIWNLKGGQGKTALSLSLALLGWFHVVTNDVHSPIDDVLPEGRALRLAAGEPLPQVPEGVKLIYDLGWYAEPRVIEAVKQADWVIVPLIYESPLEMQVTINAIAEIERYTKQIVIIVNKATPLIAGHAREVLAKFYTYPVLEVKSTTAFRHGIAKGMSLEELVKSNPIFRFHYRVPLAQLRAILEFIA